MSVSRKRLLVFVFIIALAPATVNAWLYPEHRDITLLALDTLKPEERSVLDALWSDARVGHEMRLCAQIRRFQLVLGRAVGPFRSFSRDQASSLLLQFFGGFDTPTHSSVVSPAGAPTPKLHTIAVGGVRFAFDWRHYVK